MRNSILALMVSVIVFSSRPTIAMNGEEPLETSSSPVVQRHGPREENTGSEKKVHHSLPLLSFKDLAKNEPLDASQGSPKPDSPKSVSPGFIKERRNSREDPCKDLSTAPGKCLDGSPRLHRNSRGSVSPRSRKESRGSAGRKVVSLPSKCSPKGDESPWRKRKDSQGNSPEAILSFQEMRSVRRDIQQGSPREERTISPGYTPTSARHDRESSPVQEHKNIITPPEHTESTRRDGAESPARERKNSQDSSGSSPIASIHQGGEVGRSSRRHPGEGSTGSVIGTSKFQLLTPDLPRSESTACQEQKWSSPGSQATCSQEQGLNSPGRDGSTSLRTRKFQLNNGREWLEYKSTSSQEQGLSSPEQKENLARRSRSNSAGSQCNPRRVKQAPVPGASLFSCVLGRSEGEEDRLDDLLNLYSKSNEKQLKSISFQEEKKDSPKT